jgi:chromosome segregation ATPase
MITKNKIQSATKLPGSGLPQNTQKEIIDYLVKNKIMLDEEKLNTVQSEYGSIKKNIEAKSLILTQREAEINNLVSSIKNALENISSSKRLILELVTKVVNTKNEISDFSAKQQIYLARKKRLEIEKAKVFEERAIVEVSLKAISEEVESIRKIVDDLNAEKSNLEYELYMKGVLDRESTIKLEKIQSYISRAQKVIDKYGKNIHKMAEKAAPNREKAREAVKKLVPTPKISVHR